MSDGALGSKVDAHAQARPPECHHAVSRHNLPTQPKQPDQQPSHKLPFITLTFHTIPAPAKVLCGHDTGYQSHNWQVR